MTPRDVDDWLRLNYPTTIVADRYDGCYSHARWLAFPLYICDVPEEISDEDIPCMCFWDDYDEPVGKGATPEDALADLTTQMQTIFKTKDNLKKLLEK